MKNLTPLLFACLCYAPQISFAQCGTANEPQFITSQADLDALSGCELFQGDLNIEGSDITNIDGLASLAVVLGNLNIYDTHITSIDSASLGSLTTVNEINIYNNQYLSACCGALVWQDALDLGTISSVNFSSNASGCNSYFDAQATCLGEVPGCVDAAAVNYNWQATLDDGSCLNGIDLQVSVSTILNSLQVNTFTSSDDCLVAEGCITGTGTRKTLRFTTTISNYGNEDFIIGYEVDDNSQFYYDDCHNHYHYEGYANYQVFNYPNLSPSATIGHKNGWCVMDLGGAVSSENPGWNTPGCSFTYGCSYMGISAGCSDTYSSGISCQWVDITDLADGEYVLAVSTNMETENYSPTPELDFSNNVVYVLFEIGTNDQGVTSVVSATEFDGSAINDICVLDSDATDLGFNFSDAVVASEQQTLFPTAYLNEYYTQPVQFVLTENINLNGLDVSVDSLVINEVSDLPLGLNWACAPQSCSFPVGNSCMGLTGIPEETGSFDISIAATLYFTDTTGISQQITLPYNGGNQWVDGVLGENDQAFDSFTPSININVEVPVYGCTDTLAINYSDTATFDDGSCELPNMGCTDPFSLNFNPEANFEDGSCEYCAEGIEWVVQMDLYDTYGDGWTGNNYYIINEWGDTSATGTLEDGSQGADLFCLAPGCYSVNVPNEGTYPDNVTWQITSAGFSEVNLTGSCPDSRPFSFLTDACEFVEGCTQPNAPNYNDQANIDDGSCLLSCEVQYQDTHVSGNNDNTSFEYLFDSSEVAALTIVGETETRNSSSNPCWDYIYVYDGAGNQLETLCGSFDQTIVSNDNGITLTWDTDGSVDGYTSTWSVNCIVQGCTDSVAENYDSLAIIDDSSCTYVNGCTNIFAENFYSLATVDDGSCSFSGIPGCIDSLACNFDLLAETNDGSCVFAPIGQDCEGNCLVNSVSFDMYVAEGYGFAGATYTITHEGQEVASGPSDPGYWVSLSDTFCLVDGCYDVYVSTSDYPSYDNVFTWSFGQISGTANQTAFASFGAIECITACTNPNATNFNASADISDNSLCTFDLIQGCVDSLACNFDTLAQQDDGSCYNNDLGCGCDEPAVLDGYDCDGNLIPLVCGDSLNNSGYYEYVNNDETIFDFIVDSNETAVLTISGQTELYNSVCYDEIQIKDAAGVILAILGNNPSIACNFSETIVSNDNGITIQFNSDYIGSPSTNATIDGTSWSIDCAPQGCTDGFADNYDSLAVIDDGSCVLTVTPGCTDSLACNFDTLADVNDGSCDLVSCLDFCGVPNGDNTSCADACGVPNGDNSSCADACGVPNGDNSSCADACGVPNGDNSSCTDCAGVVNGDSNEDECGVCDSDSLNNNITCLDCAGIPNGTLVDLGCGCGEPAQEPGYDCDGNLIPLVCLDSTNVGYYEYDDNDDSFFEYIYDSTEIALLTIIGETEINDDGGCWDYIYIYDGAGIALDTLCGEFNQTILSNDNGITIQFVSDFSISAQSSPEIAPSSWSIDCGVQGCMDSIAENYNSFATFDDSSCTYTYGCMDLTACNYDSLATLSNADCTYPSEGFDCDSNCIGDNCLEHQDIYLSAGWSIMSSYIENEGGDSIDLVIQPIVESVVILKNNLGNAYLPDWNFNAIGSWDNTQGYQLKLTDAQVLTINGTQVKPEETPVSITAGWNMIAYLRVEDADLVAVFNDIIDDIVIVKDFMGSAYLPEWSFNAIGDMTAGQGYQIKMNQANELIYNENGEDYRISSNHVIDNWVSHIDFDKNTGSNMHLVIPQGAWANRVADGDEVYVYDTQGATIGAVKVTLPNTVVTLWGNDLLTDQKDGLDDGEQWRIVLFSVERESLIPLSFDLKEEHYGFQQDALVVASQITESFTESKTVLFNSVPNPTSNRTEISFYLNKDLDITLRLFNAIGEEIKVISKGPKALGYHSVQLDVSYLEPGIYFYQLESEAGQMTKSLEVIK